MPVSMDQKLKNLHQTADEMLSGMQAAPMGAQQILRKEQGERKPRVSSWVRVGAPVFAALVLFSGILLWRSSGNFRTPTSTPAVETIAAGESSGEKNYPARADLPVGSVTLSGGGNVSFMNLFAGNSMSSFPMIQVNGAYYRMLNEPQNLSSRALGKAIGQVSRHSSSPQSDSSGISSNTILEGETVYRVQSLDGAAVAARVNGDLRVFQRVSVNGKGIPEAMSALLGNASVSEISLSGAGRVNDSGTIRRLLQILTRRSTFLSGSCSATSQGLYITFDNGVTLQFYVSGSTVMSCGAWSCGEFMEELRQAAR